MLYAGLDVHKRETEVAIIDEDGRLVHRERVPTTREALTALAKRRFGPTVRVALEATTNTWGVVDILAPYCAEVVVSNPLRARAIAEAKVKTDKVDALVLAQLLRCEFLPPVWRPDGETRALRDLTTRRAVLVAERTRLKNRLHSVLHQRLIPAPPGDLFGTRGRAWLQIVKLDELGRAQVESDLRLLDAVEQELARLGETLVPRAFNDARVKLLLTLPGVDYTVAQALLAALGEITRFRDGDHAAAYLGIVPSTRQSADSCYHGPITKRGRGHARWLLVQAAQHLDRHPGPLGVFFRKLMRKKSRNVAVVATARKLVVIAWHMLTTNEPYRYAQPFQTREKLARLRRAAGVKRPHGGIAKGASRPAAYGTGARTRLVPTLADAYAAEDVPAPQPLAPGERRMLEDQRLARYVASLGERRREPRAPRQAAQKTR